ncbi:MAG: polyprenyl synthetase family protein, partial [Bacteroidales bacterium]|nr:polyprenyl synthetase family protein [Bacteroidales bacterium]
REVVSATPFQRRLLLLPQCLRNNLQCQGVFDEMGLLCAGCKSCQLDNILAKAEQLGYATLVAEGTTVAIGLVEEGSIDAVIGVSCMPVLQNSFAPVTRAAVPAIGLPLLFDGCENTSLDYNWLFTEMEQFSENHQNSPLSVSLLKNSVNEYFTPERLNAFFPGQTDTEKLARKMMAMGGQRMRPLLAVLAYQSYAGEVNEEIQVALAMVIECFHKASLLHDDIQDDADVRYNQPTLHKTDGIPVAINIGDYLVGKGYHILSQIQCNPVIHARCLGVVSASHLKLSEGQGADILLPKNIADTTVDGMLRIFEQKTGEAVKVALITGAIAGNAPDADLEHLAQFSAWFGIAYQIRDDLNEFLDESERKHPFDFPFLLALLNQSMNGESPKFPEMLQKNNFGILLDNLNKYQVKETADEYLQEYIAKCYAGLDRLQNLKLRLGLYGIMGKVFKT